MLCARMALLAAALGRYCFNFTGPGAGAWAREKKTDSFVRRRVLALARIGVALARTGGGTGPDRQPAGAPALMFAPTNAARCVS